MFTLPGKKLIFMGGELGQWNEWNHDGELDWSLLDYPHHRGVQQWLADLNRLHRAEPALHALDFDPQGFEWIDCRDAEQSVISFARRGHEEEQTLLVVCNFTPVPRHNYRVGLPAPGIWSEKLNGDAESYGGSGLGNPDALRGVPIPWHGRSHSAVLTVPPLAVVVLKREAAEEPLPGSLLRA
jgi:1,4-alpha-glucan branching enzyme